MSPENSHPERDASEDGSSQNSTLHLSAVDSKLFAECLLAPEPVAEVLEQAAERRRKLVDPS